MREPVATTPSPEALAIRHTVEDWRLAIAEAAEADDYDLPRHINAAAAAAVGLAVEFVGPEAAAGWLTRLAAHFLAAVPARSETVH